LHEIEEYLSKSCSHINSNANISYSFSGLKSYLAGTFLARDILKHSPAGDLHRKGSLYIHDLDNWFAPYCFGADLGTLISKGIINPAGVSSKPAKHFDVVIDHMINFIYTSQTEFAGAQAFSHIDVLLAPFARYDGLSYRQIKQNIQRLIYSFNFPLRSSFQCPFVNLSFDFRVPETLADQNVLYNGEEQNDTYGEFQEEVELINKAFLEVMIEGDKTNQPFPFPIPTYNMTKDFDWDSENANLLFELTAKYGLPYFMNLIGSGIPENSTTAMCCRLQLDLTQLPQRRGLWNFYPNTGSIGVVTLNMSQLGYLSKNEEDYYERLDFLLDKAKGQLVEKRRRVNELFSNDLLPFVKNYICGFDTFFNTIGLVGMNESCVNLFGVPITDCQSFVEDVLSYIRQKTLDFQKETGQLFNFEATPAESAAHKLAVIDRKRFGDKIYTQGNGTPYYTNSSNVPVDFDLDLISRLEIEERFQQYYTGGSIFHLFHGQHMDREQSKFLVKNICTNTKLPYIDITPTYSICDSCGIIYGVHYTCPKCNAQTKVYSRITGYYRPTYKWNPGKRQEFEDRKMLL